MCTWNAWSIYLNTFFLSSSYNNIFRNISTCSVLFYKFQLNCEQNGLQKFSDAWYYEIHPYPFWREPTWAQRECTNFSWGPRGLKPRTFLLSGNSANHCTTMLTDITTCLQKISFWPVLIIIFYTLQFKALEYIIIQTHHSNFKPITVFEN